MVGWGLVGSRLEVDGRYGGGWLGGGCTLVRGLLEVGKRLVAG